MSYLPRNSAVIYTGKRSGFYNYYKTYFRIVKTANERRQYYACENKILIRGSRRPNILWKTFDDVQRIQQRSWKKQSKASKQHGYNQKKIREFFRFYDELLLMDIY